MDSGIVAAIISAAAILLAALIRPLLSFRRARRSSRTEQMTLPVINMETSRLPAKFPKYSAPACVFLAGEHAVMFGHAALYLPLP